MNSMETLIAEKTKSIRQIYLVATDGIYNQDECSMLYIIRNAGNYLLGRTKASN